MQAAGQHGRHSFRSRHKAHDFEGASSGDLDLSMVGVYMRTSQHSQHTCMHNYASTHVQLNMQEHVLSIMIV